MGVDQALQRNGLARVGNMVHVVGEIENGLEMCKDDTQIPVFCSIRKLRTPQTSAKHDSPVRDLLRQSLHGQLHSKLGRSSSHLFGVGIPGDEIAMIKFPGSCANPFGSAKSQVGLSENVVYPEKPNGFHDHYPYSMAISLEVYPIFRHTQVVEHCLARSHVCSTMFNHVWDDEDICGWLNR